MMISKRRFYIRWCTWRSRPTSGILIGICMVILLILLALHFYVLPRASGTYNNECYLTDQRRSNLRYAVQMIGKTMEKYNVTYWLDYGTLLGAVRFGDVLPWDGDADVSLLLEEQKSLVHEELQKYDIHSNGLIATYKGETIDYMRWSKEKGFYDGKEQVILHKFYPQSVLKNENIFVLHHHKLESFPFAWVKPTKTIDFHGVKLAAPNDVHKFMRHRYPLTYFAGLSVPYKWKCWVPCWMRNANSCS